MTLTKRLLLLALISVLPAIVIWTYTEVSLRRAREAEVNDFVIRQVRLAAAEMERIFEGIHGLLTAIDETASVYTFDAPECRAYLHAIQQKVPHILSFVVLDLEGRVRCSQAYLPNAMERRFTERSYFQETVTTQQFSIGEFTPDFVEGGLGPRPVLPLALPVWDPGGKYVGVAAAALDLEWLSQKLKERVLAEGRSLTIADRHGVILAREPFPERFIGTKLPEAALQKARSGEVGTYETISIDGIKRILAYIPVGLPPQGVYISAGLSTEAAFGDINRAANRGFLLIGAALILAMSLSWLTSHAFITRPFETVTDAVREWRRGDFRNRIDLRRTPGELALVAGAFNDLLDDVAERERDLRASEERARLALEAGHMGTWWYDGNEDVGGWSSQAAILFGQPPAKTNFTMKDWLSIVHPGDVEPAQRHFQAAAQSGGDYEDEYRILWPNGEVRWINTRGRAFRDQGTKTPYFIGVLQDITSRRQAEEQQRFLLDELNHRVKNTLATVQSIASQTLRSSPEPASFKAAFEGRLLALSKTHDLLTRNSWRAAGLRDIAEQELAPYRRAGDERIAIQGSNVRLPPRHAINLGLILHELATNAVKYGSLATPTGHIELRWVAKPDEEGVPHLRLHWQESNGPLVHPPQREGFGSKLIRRSIEGELSGTLAIDFAPSGIVYDISVPMARETETPQYA